MIFDTRTSVPSSLSVVAVVHASQWPEPEPLRAVLAPIEALGAHVRVVRALERRDRPLGAAALINQAARGAREDVLLVAEPCMRWTTEQLERMVAAAADGLAIATCAGIGAARPRLWSIARRHFEALGGLDARMWSIGEIDDLRARAAVAGLAQAHLSEDGDWLGPESYPLTAAVREFLAIRGRLLTAATTLPVDTLGCEMAVVATTALLAAWQAAGIDPARFRFREEQQSLVRRLLGFATASATTRPADEAGTLVPLLALDAFLSDLKGLMPERQRLTSRRDAASGGSDEDLVDRLVARVQTAPTEPPPEYTAGLKPCTSAASGDAAPAGSAGPAAGSDAPGRARPATLPMVSVVVVSWNGRQHLRPLFSSLEASDWPPDRLEPMLVDNGSTDGSLDLMARDFPRVRLVPLRRNLGFTGGNNAGVAAARGDVLVFLNNDVRVDPAAIRELVTALDERHPCVAARVLSWDGRHIDFIRGTVNFEARGFQDHYGQPVRSFRLAVADSFFPNGGAFAITRAVYESCGGFDDRYFAYYDDVDLGWRLRLLGWSIRVVPSAIVYHRHGATSRRHPAPQKRFLMERNALWTVLKNYDENTLRRTLGPMLLLAARRIVQEASIARRTAFARSLAPFSFRCRNRLLRTSVTTADVYEENSESAVRHAAPRVSQASVPGEVLAAIGSALQALPAVAAARRAIQGRRTASDALVLPHMGRTFESASGLRSYCDAQEALVELMELRTVFRPRSRVLIITHEPIRAEVSGPGVRVLEIGRALAAHLQVTVATPDSDDQAGAWSHATGGGVHGARAEAQEPRAPGPCTIARYDFSRPATLRALAEGSDVILLQGFTLARFPFLEALDVPLIVDLYCPFTLEHLEMTRARRGGLSATPVEIEAAEILAVQNEQLRAGDFFLCASERQRDFWIGGLHAAGRVNPQTYAADPTLRTLIDVVPFGIPDEEIAGPGALKGLHPAIGDTDRVLYWGGSILDWQDPQTLVRAVALLRQERDDVKLVFAGTRHPNPQVPRMRAIDDTVALARDLGVLDTHVIFNDWVPYQERGAWLRDADLGLSTHRDHLETRFSFRTRMLDYVWAGVPIVCTVGDHFADLVAERHLGLTVPPGDETALAEAIRALLDDEALRRRCRQNLEAVKTELRWSRITAPLLRFCAAPEFAADRAPAVRAIRRRLEGSFRLSKWIKRTALGVGLSEARFEQIKRLPPIRAGMSVRNRIARARAERAGR